MSFAPGTTPCVPNKATQIGSNASSSSTTNATPKTWALTEYKHFCKTSPSNEKDLLPPRTGHSAPSSNATKEPIAGTADHPRSRISCPSIRASNPSRPFAASTPLAVASSPSAKRRAVAVARHPKPKHESTTQFGSSSPQYTGAVPSVDFAPSTPGTPRRIHCCRMRCRGIRVGGPAG